MSGTNKLIQSTLEGGSESALTAGLMNANEVAKKNEGKGKKKITHEEKIEEGKEEE